jgi:hypothetical protein
MPSGTIALMSIFQSIPCTVTRLVDAECQPFVVEFEVVDIRGKHWKFVEKSVYAGVDPNRGPEGPYPHAGTVFCTRLGDLTHADGRPTTRVWTERPYFIESLEGLACFEVWKSDISSVPMPSYPALGVLGMDAADAYESAGPKQRLVATVAALEVAIARTGITEPLVQENMGLLRRNIGLVAAQRAELPALESRLNDQYIELLRRVDPSESMNESCGIAYRRARAVSALAIATSRMPGAFAAAIHEATLAVEQHWCFHDQVLAALRTKV